MTGFCTAVVDCKRDLPPSVAAIFPTTEENAAEISFDTASLQSELLTLFTGGSTGSPKIWSKTAGNIFSEALFMIEEYGVSQDDIIAATISPYHIYGLLFSVVIPLTASASVLGETPLFPAEIADCVQKKKAPIFVSVPAHYRVLHDRKTSARLRIAISSAGMLPEEDSLAFSKINSVPVVEIYGSTETGGLASRNRYDGEENFTPLRPVQWQIMNERLYVQSPFISPDVPVNTENLFLSGDKVKACGENCFSLHGRADTVTKVGGERVDLDEVRDVLQQQAGIKECVVIAIPDKTGRGNRIAALVRGDAVDLSQIKKELPSLLETAALPRVIKVATVIPTTASGKYDRAAIIHLLT
jgi:acyl-coenzyme A synthetase/AMP-(fatty) acid ligase